MSGAPRAESASAPASARVESRSWALSLFRRSVLKQAKYRRIVDLLGPTEGRSCLDVGADNGVISLLLRQRGGDWTSADLDERAVRAIRELVGGEVVRLDGRTAPFADRSFDTVVIVDFLEHTHTDGEFVRDLARVIRPGGSLLVNVPHVKPWSLINRLRHAVGLTDEKHGHVRPGYRLEDLRRLLEPEFQVEESRTYSRAFSELIDTALNLAFEILGRLKGARTPSSKKGTLVTSSDLKRNRKEFLLLSALYPLLRLIAALDHLLVLQSGYKLILRARRRP